MAADFLEGMDASLLTYLCIYAFCSMIMMPLGILNDAILVLLAPIYRAPINIEVASDLHLILRPFNS